MRIDLCAVFTVVAMGLCVVGSAVCRAQEGALTADDAPRAPEPQVIRERGPSPRHYRYLPRSALYVSRISIGGGLRHVATQSKTSGAFALDVLPVGVEVGFGRVSRWALLLETGYSYVSPSEHLFTAGAGVVYRWFGPTILDAKNMGRPAGDLTVGVVPHLLAGGAQGHPAVGLRTTVFVNFAFLGLSLSHQYLVSNGLRIHEVYLGVNLYYRLVRS